MKKLSTTFLFLLLVLSSKMFAQTEYFEADVNNYGQLEQVLGDKWDKIDSLTVSGPVDATDISMMWKCAFYGKTTALNLQNAQVKDNEIPDKAFFHEDVQLTETSIIVFPLKRVILPESIEKIGDFAFNRVLLEHINMPANLKELGKYSFNNCQKLKLDTLSIPEGVTIIPFGCFNGCRKIKSVKLPKGIKEIGPYSFIDARITDINLPEGLEVIGEGAFSQTDLVKVVIPSTVKILNNSMFANCPYLKEIQIPDKFNSIPASFAFGCTELEKVNIPKSTEIIYISAFFNNSKLKTVKLPEGLKELDYQAFDNCAIDSIIFPSTLRYLAPLSCSSWKNIKEIHSLSPNPPLCGKEGKEGAFYLSNKDIPVYVPAGSGELYRKAEGWKEFTNIIEMSDGNISLGAPDVEADKGTVAKLSAFISGGKAPYYVTWYDKYNQEFANETYNGEDCTAEVELIAHVSEDITIKVVDSKGMSAFAVQRLKVRKMDKECATFDDVYVGALHYSKGRYKVDDCAPEEDWYNSFVSGPFSFTSYSPSSDSWNTGFTCTDLETSDFVVNDKKLIYATAAQSGHKESAHYVTICDSAYMTLVCGDRLKHTISGFYVSASAAAYKSVKEGSDLAPAFKKGDYLCLTVTDETTGRSVDFFVADYRSDNEYDHYCLDSWQWADLRSLNTYGSKLKFKLSGTQILEDYKTGNAMPALVCIDDFNGTLDVDETSAQTLRSGDVINLADILPLPDNGATVEYSVYNISADNFEDVKYEINGAELKISLPDNIDTSVGVNVIVKQLSAGIARYASIPLTITSGISEVTSEAETDAVYTTDGRRVNKNATVKGINIIRMSDGTVKKVVVK